MPVDVVRLGAAELPAYAPGVVDVYRQTFGAAPYVEDEARLAGFAEQVLPTHAPRRDFRCVVGLEAGEVLGFAYGYTGEPGQWWHDRVVAQLGAAAAEWATEPFEVVTLAVRPAAQRRGIGGRLHDALLTGLSNRTALLSVWDTGIPALRLYRRRGWLTLRDDAGAPGGPARLVMGLRLPPL
jgi:ribosomal protein S18 acetylase RimI-like enzyme